MVANLGFLVLLHAALASCHSGVVRNCSLVNFRSFARDDGVRLNSFTNISAIVVLGSKLCRSPLMILKQVCSKILLCGCNKKELFIKKVCRLGEN